MPGADAWPLTGRASELRTVMSMLESGAVGGVLLVGDAGVGKTRLLREILNAWLSAGGAAEWVAATGAARSVPFGAVSHLFPADARPSANPTMLASRVAGRFADPDARWLVGIDDAHLLDDGSAALLQQLSVRGLAIPVASMRLGEPVSDAVTAMWKDGGAWVSVRPLAPEAVDELLDYAVPGPLDSISRRRLRRLSAGNPLLLRELLADGIDTGALRQRAGVYRWRGPAPVSPRLGELTAARLRTLDPAARAVLETIACGEPLPMSMLEGLAEPAAVEAAERSGMAVAEPSGARMFVRLAHPLYGEVLRAGLPVSRARRIWGRLAEAAAAGPMRRRDDPLLTGVWELWSGVVRHPDLLLTAAREAIARFDLGLAEQLARAARNAGHGWEADQLLAEILSNSGHGEEAITVLPNEPPAGDERLAHWAVTRASILYWGLGRVDEAEQVLRTRAGALGWDLAESVRSWILLFDGRCRAALGAAEQVIHQPGTTAQALVWATMSGTAAAGMLGRLTEATSLAERGRAVADQLPWGPAQIGFGICCALRANGLLVQARTVAEDGYRAAIATESADMAAIWAGLRGVVAKAQGRLDDARAALREAVALAAEVDPFQILRPCLAELAGVAALSGDSSTARELMARADELKRPANRLYDAWVELDRAWVHAAEGALSEAVAVAHRAAALARDSEQPTFEAVALYDAARLGVRPLPRERLEELAKLVEGEFVPGLARAVGALAAADGSALEQAGKVLANLGHPLLAAELHTVAAQVFRRAGRRTAARTAAGHAAAILTGVCHGARTLLLDMGGPHAVLTQREREIAKLATSLSSRRIADRLDLSVHTVNNTLARAYAKLGIRTRSELTALFGIHEPPVD